MSLSYDPDSSLVDITWEAAFVSQRDVAGQIPINFVTTSAVCLRSACFGNNVFDRDLAGRCISNLLALGYRRFIVDLYWSVESRTWNFCPVSIPSDVQVVTISSTSTSMTTGTSTASTTTVAAAQGSATVISNSSGSQLYALGPYLCSDGLNLSDMVDIFEDFFKSTASQLNIYTRYVSFNLHAATTATAVNRPASKVSGADLPSIPERIDSLVDRLYSYIYTPSQLADERSNLNDSWYKVDDGYEPITEYITIDEDEDGKQSTTDGWPSTKYVQLAKERRLLLEYGSVDPQMEDYNMTEKDEIIFPQGSLTTTIPITVSGEGLESGCYYNADASGISQVNSSWAVSSPVPVSNDTVKTQFMRRLSDLITNVTACGLTPTINNTLFNATADKDFEPYKNATRAAMWAWALGEPRGSEVTDDIDQPGRDRCAVMDLSLGGHWRVINCAEKRRGACRVGNDLFTWKLTSTEHIYSDVYHQGCPENSSLAVPRTALENTYLYWHALDKAASGMDPNSSDPSKRELWIDFNCLDVASCWITGGPDANCPYASDPQQLQKRTVLVAAIAGIVICIITALTLFVKCNTNRRNSRRGKRVIQGWEYEGVPS
ncbi:hypothetical protein EYZ11_007622 [Aspergillus tanneri]|uniref:Maintenance of telomere capping protein 6 n=1 Tax=Aspergillus tanneri TaxID=1220188 RepID=A0A4S3JET6_9EURO|nr:uncharacterized protein ATNIH1004_003461 [Aspergillus tanneri]KAA8650772.1 hypothetical protein ATNIH1004_003461 [Aspergillus tanneri]THC92898.1 hypothetical protein EYZ11_007622 [Aspergillus tanneri]